MYSGKIMETMRGDEVFSSPLHPYTQALLSAVPQINVDERKKRIILSGEPPNPINPPKGCRFNPRCPYSRDICRKKEPDLTDIKGHIVACHFVEEIN
jgi:oligopeptide/dipeptide ABC transporter ATP-binding protein